MSTHRKFSQGEPRDKLEWALHYAARGWPVFPCCWPDDTGRCACGGGHEGKEIGKAPLRTVSHGWRCATRDLNVIREWWTRWPQANIGVALSSSDPPLLVVDLDGPEAVQEALRLGLPPGPVSQTGNGFHYFYIAPAGSYSNGIHKGDFGKIDIIVNGYIIVPPSRHRSGCKYEWAIGPDEPLQAAPEWAVRLLGKPVVGGAVSLPTELPPISLDELRLSPRLKDLIQKGASPEYPSRSEAMWAVITALASVGHSDSEIARVLFNYPIGEKAREQGLEWMKGEITRAREKTGTKIWTVAELFEREFPTPSFLIPGLLPEGGVAILAGRPKIGKSWFALELSCGLATGSKVAGIEVGRKYRVLYLALEDSPRRIKERLTIANLPQSPDCYISNQWPRLDSGGAIRLRSAIEEIQAGVVVVDPLAKIRPREEPGRSLYSLDYEAIDVLKRLSDELRVTFIVIHHLRKVGSEDPLLEVLGTTGLTGAADTILVLKRARGEVDATLFITGRDIEEQEVALAFASGRWRVLGDAKEYSLSKERQAILNAIRALGDEARPHVIAEFLGKNPNTTRVLLRRMCAEGRIREVRGAYTCVV